MTHTIKSRIWIEVDNKILLGEGRVRLLKAIEKTGSLSKAAKALQMSYKKARRLTDAVNKSAKEPVIIRTADGKDGRGITLTPYGKKLIAAFETINQNCWKFLDQQLATVNI